MLQHHQQLNNAQATLQQIQQQLQNTSPTGNIVIESSSPIQPGSINHGKIEAIKAYSQRNSSTNQALQQQLQSAQQELQEALNNAGLGQHYAIQQTLNNLQQAQQQLQQNQNQMALSSLQQAQNQLTEAQRQAY